MTSRHENELEVQVARVDLNTEVIFVESVGVIIYTVRQKKPTP